MHALCRCCSTNPIPIRVIFAIHLSIHLYMLAACHTSCFVFIRMCSVWDNLVWLLRRTSVVSRLAAVGSLTGSRQRVPQGADGRVLDPQRSTHQQQHCLPGALHPAPNSGFTSFTLMPPGRHRDKHSEISCWCIFYSFVHVRFAHIYACSPLLMATE